jgi:flagellar hook-associated protein 1 FlgK
MTAISTFMGLQTALRGILAQQRSLDVTGHNISNANTPGYSRQEAVLRAAPSYQVPIASSGGFGRIGTGVDVVQYKRIRDDFVDVQLYAQNLRKGAAEATAEGLEQVELALAEPGDTGLSSLLQRYWASWQDVANAPESLATRQALVQNAQSLATAIQGLDQQLAQIANEAGQEVTTVLEEVNQAAKDLARLNDAIQTAQVMGDTPNDLLDERDLILDKLSKLGALPLDPDPDGDGLYTITFNGVTIVDELTSYTLSESGGTIENDMATPETASLAGKSGKLAALVQLRDTTLPSYRGDLDAIAAALITNTNALHAAGTGLGGTTGVDFFLPSPAPATGAAQVIAVNPALLTDPRQVAASASGEPGDNSVALQIAGVRTAITVGGTTIDGAYSQLVTQIGSDAKEAQRTLANATVLADALENRRSSVSGVSLDEEMTNLLRFQRGYQAAARALTAMDEMIELIVTRTGRVGL